MVVLFSSVFVVRSTAILLFFSGLCEFMIHMQKISVNDYEVGTDAIPFLFSIFSVASAGCGIFLSHKEFIARGVTFSVATSITSFMGAKHGHANWNNLKDLKACSTYAPNTRLDPCLDYFDDSNLLTAPITIPDKYRTNDDVVQKHHATHHEQPVKELSNGRVWASSFDNSKPKSNSQQWNNATWFTNEFDNDISCYGDNTDYFVAAYYCSFYTLAQGTQKEDYCYCVSESATDGSPTCHEFHKFPFCGDLLHVMIEIMLAGYVLGTVSFVCSVIQTFMLLFIYYQVRGVQVKLNLFDLFEELRHRTPATKKAVAHFSNEGIVMSSVLDNTVMIENQLMSSEEAVGNNVARIIDDLVRDFDDEECNVEGRQAAPTRPPSFIKSNGVGASSALSNVLFKVGYNKIQPAAIANPVTPRRRLFQNRVAPQHAEDVQLDVAQIHPTPQAIEFEGEHLPPEESILAPTIMMERVRVGMF